MDDQCGLVRDHPCRIVVEPEIARVSVNKVDAQSLVPVITGVAGYRGSPGLKKRIRLMPRTSYNESVHAHSLTFSTQHKLLLFKDLYLCDIMLNQIALARKRGFYKLYAYVIMPNHVHLIINPLNKTIAQILIALKRKVSEKALVHLRATNEIIYSQLVVQQGRRSNHRFWLKGGGYDRNIFDNRNMYKMIEYVHANPVRWQLAREPESYNYSSAKAYATGQPNPIHVDLFDQNVTYFGR